LGSTLGIASCAGTEAQSDAMGIQRSGSAWWLTYPSEKYEFVSWDDDIPNLWKVIKFMFQATNQSLMWQTQCHKPSH
jgi:hypothetical protein